jgi:hypothetical protein
MEQHDGLKIVGQLDAAVFDMRSREAQHLEQQIIAHIAKQPFLNPVQYRGRYLELVGKLRKLSLARQYRVANLVTTIGRSVLAQRLANTTTYTGTINYGALGSSATAVANADTQLGTEVFRKVTASTSYTNNVAFIDFFYSKADTNGTYQEFGTFIDGTGSANTGQIFNHALTGGWTKSASESMTVSCTFTLS